MTSRARAAGAAATIGGTGAALLATVLVGSASAATPGITVHSNNADVQSRCTFVVNSYSAATLTAKTKLTAWAAPATFAGYGNNKVTQVFCKVLDNNGNLLTQYNPLKNSNTVGATSITPTIPYSPTYTVCGHAQVKLKSGAISTTGEVCLTG